MNHHRMFWEPNSILLQEYYGLLTAEPPHISSVFPFENDLFTDILGGSTIPVLVPGGMGKLKEPRRWHKPTLNKSEQFLVLRVLSTWGRRDSAVLILQLLCARHFYYVVLTGVVVFHFLSLVFCNPPALAAGNWIQGLAIARQALCHWAKPWATFSLLTPDSYCIPLFLPDRRKSGVAAAINPMMAIFHPANFFLSFFSS